MMINIGVLDAALRLAIGIGLILFGRGSFESLLGEALGWAALLAGIALVASSLLRYCPLYARFGLDSCAPIPTATTGNPSHEECGSGSV